MKKNKNLVFISITVLFIIMFISIKRVLIENKEDKQLDERLLQQEMNIEKLLNSFSMFNDVSVEFVLNGTVTHVNVTLDISDTIDKEELEKIILIILKNVKDLEKENIKIYNQSDKIIYPIES